MMSCPAERQSGTSSGVDNMSDDSKYLTMKWRYTALLSFACTTSGSQLAHLRIDFLETRILKGTEQNTDFIESI